MKTWICKEQKSRQVTTTLSAFEPISTPFQSGLVVLLEKIKSEGTRVLNREWVTDSMEMRVLNQTSICILEKARVSKKSYTKKLVATMGEELTIKEIMDLRVILIRFMANKEAHKKIPRLENRTPKLWDKIERMYKYSPLSVRP